MGTSATQSKQRYNTKSYDRLYITVKRGEKAKITQKAAAGGESLNEYVCRLIAEDLKRGGGNSPPPYSVG